ncbi:MAG: tRNA 2-selenouridine(34) synthase MnmH [Pseudomonadota bacterium]
MAFKLTDFNALQRAAFDTIIDVRAPLEFAEDHLPGAINLPVLSDAERARVGTIYVQDSPFKARKLGAALVARNAAGHLENTLAEKDESWRPLLYCWRGGQRSGSFASILSQIGWRVETLDGGYRSYRRVVVDFLYERAFPAQVFLLDGNTGTAKSEVLRLLPALGVQVLDLEEMAGHRGSALGGQGTQPSQKAFESKLAASIAALDPARPVLIEAESSRIGRINLPPQLFGAMRASPRIEIVAPISVRAAYLCRAYRDLTSNEEALVARLRRLVRIQGHARVDAWVELAQQGAFPELAQELMEHHYDPRYGKKRPKPPASSLKADDLTPEGVRRLAEAVAEAVSQLQTARISG